MFEIGYLSYLEILKNEQNQMCYAALATKIHGFSTFHVSQVASTQNHFMCTILKIIS